MLLLSLVCLASFLLILVLSLICLQQLVAWKQLLLWASIWTEQRVSRIHILVPRVELRDRLSWACRFHVLLWLGVTLFLGWGWDLDFQAWYFTFRSHSILCHWLVLCYTAVDQPLGLLKVMQRADNILLLFTHVDWPSISLCSTVLLLRGTLLISVFLRRHKICLVVDWLSL